MKNFYLICLILTALCANAQQMIVPSSFDENKMIVKQMDKDGNFVPVEENTLAENITQQSATNRSNRQEKFLSEKAEAKKKAAIKKNKEEKKDPPKKKFRKVEKDYSIPKSTFGSNAYDMNLPSTFSNETMKRAKKDLDKERYSFEECSSDDKDCQEYDMR